MLVVQEIFGVHEHIKDMCRRLAKLGYFAVAADLYRRQGDVSKISDIQEIFAKVVNVPDCAGDVGPRRHGGLGRSTGKADTSRLGITGFCWGGRIVWTVLRAQPEGEGGGRLVRPPRRAGPSRAAARTTRSNSRRTSRCRCSGSTAAQTPASRSIIVEQMRAALKAAGNTVSEIVVYAGAPHAFYADYRPSYRKEAAEDGWKRMRAWLSKFGVA